MRCFPVSTGELAAFTNASEWAVAAGPLAALAPGVPAWLSLTNEPQLVANVFNWYAGPPL